MALFTWSKKNKRSVFVQSSHLIKSRAWERSGHLWPQLFVTKRQSLSNAYTYFPNIQFHSDAIDT